jgi:zinc transport system ATP-binding protein
MILEVKNLKVVLGGRIILENLNFSVAKGEIFVILGPNGAGKTVLLRTLLNLLPYEGKFQWFPPDIKIGYVPQRINLIEDLPLTVAEFFQLKNISEKEMLNSLKAVGLSEKFFHQQIGKLSFGQFQRVLIAYGISQNPEVLLFDEPTAGIDLEGEETVYKMIEKIAKERNLTILLVTHDLNVVYQYATNVLCLNKKAVCYGPPRKVLTKEKLDELFGNEVKFYHYYH